MRFNEEWLLYELIMDTATMMKSSIFKPLYQGIWGSLLR